MFLKNYTSNVPVSETIGRIERVLIRCGVTGIMKEYVGTEGEIHAITFQIESPGGKVTVRLPADRHKALDALFTDYVGIDKITSDDRVNSPYKKKRRKDFEEQASRTAWKLVQDWVEVQMSMIQMNQAETLQVFLPYIYDGERTFYDRVRASGYRALLPEKTDS